VYCCHNKNYTVIIMDNAGALAVSLARLKLMKPGIDHVFCTIVNLCI